MLLRTKFRAYRFSKPLAWRRHGSHLPGKSGGAHERTECEGNKLCEDHIHTVGGFGRHTVPHKDYIPHHHKQQIEYIETLTSIHGVRHQLKHRVQEKVTIKVAEKFVGSVIPRLLKRGGKTLAGRVLIRKVARGMAIAIPAVGGLFGLIITFVDWKRSQREILEGNDKSARAFRNAMIFDMIDVAVHIFVAAGLGGLLATFIPDTHEVHHYVHMAEWISVGAAVCATAWAIAGEWHSAQKAQRKDVFATHVRSRQPPTTTPKSHVQ